MERFDDCTAAFLHAISRARDMVKLFDALTIIGPRPSNDDALRAAYFQAVSSFDFFIHEVVAVESSHRFRSLIRTKNLVLPMECAIIADPEERLNAVDADLRQRHSYKSFVDPQKLADILSCFAETPWDKIAAQHNDLYAEAAKSNDLKSQLKSIWQRRNKIAHEADVNPALSGVTLWPITKEDTEITINFLEKLGRCIPPVIAIQFAA